MAYTRKQFINKVIPIIQRSAKKVLVSVTAAQAILESNNGNSGLTVQGNALFGIKPGSSWRGKVWTGRTIEYYNGVKTTINSGFRAYSSWEESVKDHENFLISNKRYAKVLNEKDYTKACMALQKAGYATDPKYAEKLITIIESEKLYQYDEKQDNDLKKAVDKIAPKYGIDKAAWSNLNTMDLKYARGLIDKLGGIDKINTAITSKGMIFKLADWKKAYTNNQFKKEDIRSLLIKFAATL